MAAVAATLRGHDSPERRWERRLRWPVIVAAVLAIPGVFLGVSRLPEPWPTFGAILHWAVWLVFASEVLVMLVVTEDRARWLRRHKLSLFVVIVSSPLLPALALLGRSLQGAASLKLLKLTKVAQGGRAAGASKFALLRPLLKLGRLWRVVRTLVRGLRLRAVALGLLLVVVAALVLGSLTVLVEGDRYRTPAHGAWHVLRTSEGQLANVDPLAWGALAMTGLLFLAGLAWAYTRGRGASAGIAGRQR